MMNGQSGVGSDSDRSDNGTVSPFTSVGLRQRGTTRRRRARQNRREGAHWVVGRSRRQTVRTLAVCAGALLLMAIGLYFGLARQESAAPVEGAAPTGAVGAVGIV
jgi:hypothetical protein